MEKEVLKNILQKAKEGKKRKFSQTIDLIVNLKSLDLKKTKVEFFVDLHHNKGKKVRICALVGPELFDQAKKVCDNAIRNDDFVNYQKDKKIAKKLAKEYDLFIAQANIMAPVAAAFGRTFGPLGKMPNPKAGCVVPPNANLQIVYDRLQKMVPIKTLKNMVIQVPIGTESQDEEQVIDNISTVLKSMESSLPNHKNNIGKTYIKLTMGAPVEVSDK